MSAQESVQLRDQAEGPTPRTAEFDLSRPVIQ